MPELLVSPMRDDQTDAFAAIWVPWLRDTMGLTPQAEDLAIMADPASYYRAQAGEAFLATLEGKVVGAVAIKRLGEAGYEFAKLVVTEAARGQGAGRILVETCVEYARRHAGPALYLQSFNALEVALQLYRRMGFVDVPAPPGMNVLARTQVIMAMTLLH